MATTKIISWNVNGIRAVAKKGLEAFIDQEDPAILCVQETKAMPEQASDVWKNPFRFRPIWHSAERKGYSGVANFFKKSPHTAKVGMGVPKFDQEGRVIVSDLGKALLLNMYFPNGAASEERHFFKMEFLEKILKFFKKLDKEKPLILTGDFNIAHKTVDIHDPVRLDGTSGFKPEERDWMDQLVASGFTDCFRLKNPEAKDEYSWWSYRQLARQRNKGWRIDYFFVSNRFEKNVVSCDHLPKVLGSDHCPLRLVVKL